MGDENKTLLTDDSGTWEVMGNVKLLIEPSQQYLDKIQNYSPTEEEINTQVREKIAEQYDYAQEIQMLNKGLLDVNDTEYLTYKAYRQECIDWGIVEKQKYGYI